MKISKPSLKTFLPSRKCNTVRRRAIEFVTAIDVKELPLETARELFSEYIGLYDRTTLKAYFGTIKHTSKRKIFRRATYGGNNTVSNKFIELSQDIETTKGYLEKMGLVHYELRGKTWFMIVNRDAVLVPQLYERKQLFMENISLSPNSQNECFSQGERARENALSLVEQTTLYAA